MRKLGRLSLVLLVLGISFYLRFSNLNWGVGGKVAAGWHPDEQIVVKVDDSLAANHFDTDMKRAPLPENLQWARYNFSSYFYASYLWYSVASPLERAWHPKHHPTAGTVLVTYRVFSALLGVLACLLVYASARRMMPAPFAALAALFTGVLPLLVQDSHYARAEAFVTAGAVGALWLALSMRRASSAARCFWTGLLIGFLTAAKVSLAPLLLLPACSILACFWPLQRQSFRPVSKRLSVLLGGFLAGCVLGVPYGFIHWRDWWEGWTFLKTQYSHPFQPYGPYPEGYCFGFIDNYILHTFGAFLLIFAALGVVRLLRLKQYSMLFLLVPLPVFYYLTFGFQQSFFERNISHIVPWIAILAALGCLELWAGMLRASRVTELRIGALALAIVLCLWVPLAISWRLAVILLSGHEPDPVKKYEALLRNVYPGVPVAYDYWWADQVLEHIQQQLASTPEGYVLKVGDANDSLSRHQLFTAEHVFRLKLLAVVPGHFSDLPTCTLQMYHSQNFSWYLVRPNWPPKPVEK